MKPCRSQLCLLAIFPWRERVIVSIDYHMSWASSWNAMLYCECQTIESPAHAFIEFNLGHDKIHAYGFVVEK